MREVQTHKSQNLHNNTDESRKSMLIRLRQDSKTILKYQSKGKKFGKTYETMDEFCFVTSIRGFNRPNTRNNNDNDNDNDNDDDDDDDL
jgi:hypothetical protein